MRTYGLWTVQNQYENRVFYGLYEPNDTIFAGTKAGYEGWIEPDKAIDIKVDFRECKIVFWKDAPAFGLGTKVADPQKVKTDRPVTLQANKTVVQPDEADVLDPEIVEATVFLTQMEVNNLCREIAIGIAGKLPEIGKAVAALLGFLWAEQKEDVNDLIRQSEDRMKRWIQGRIQDYDRAFLRNTLSGLRSNLKEYRNAAGQGERRNWFNICLAACERAMPFFTKDGYTPGTLDMAATVATLHLTLLRERVLFPHEIFGAEQVNEPFFRQNLKETIASYQAFIREVGIPGELRWRQARIIDDKRIGEQRYLTDLVTREIHEFRHTGRHQLHQGPSQVCVDYYRAQAENAYAIQLHENVLHTALFWSWLDPDQQATHPVPLDSVTWVGPLAGLSYMVGNEHNFAFHDGVEEPPGSITSVRLKVGDRIDGIQFNFADRKGQYVGGAGGREQTVAVPQGAFLTRVETWFDFDLWAIRFHFSDGSRSDILGTPGRGGVHQFAAFPDHYVSSVRIGRRMQELSFGFTPLPDYYERLAKRR